ncbi:MAG: hypothetical protein A3E36_04580 [Candidatus Andersenbacteria bacterium RIFCSPHIGHO2_12_FULL_45_11b]|uniref:Membrane protein 6-pyruvoyl-tetrahydropterin synthase-related domain-containing protein n=1 Tax=Candidatus Andersenbacteria bacterium RIFCSPHIGHO2_12_FULL_45_11b TaxID=1797282 RepID=A0A1G1XA44_9BACT|nr:MAG: hypothetical protein A3E36_04580 [Candidatus Andersenbacteria bacterium RIFCSPHIGHO2_12_FULL_45_11b]
MNFLDFEPLQGALTGIIFGLGVLLVAYIPKYKWLAASLICIGITPLALMPFWFSYGDLGISDWDYYFSMHSTLQKSISEFHQFPLWNPYVCGGTSALGDPEFPVFSPLFLFEIAFGTPAGFVLSIYTSVAIGALGMLHFARKIGIGPVGALMASLPMAFGSVNLLEIVEGHPNILSAMYIPWVWYCWYSAYVGTVKQKKYFIIATAFLLALMFFQGGIYLLMYMAGAFIAMLFFVKNPKRAIYITLLAGILALGLASAKLIPVFYWLQQFQDAAYASSAYTLSSLHEILLGRHLHGGEDIIPNQGGGWHEYGAYIGPLVLLMALWGYIVRRKERLTRALLLSAVLAILVSAMGPYLKPMFDQMPFFPRSNVSRVILFAIIPLSLLAGCGVDALAKKKKYIRGAAILIVTLAAIDLMSLAYQLAAQAFVLPHTVDAIPEAPHPIAYSPFDYKFRHNGVDYTRAYEATNKGYGNMAYCSVLGPDPAVRIITDEGDNNIISFSHNENASFELHAWTPNTIITTVKSVDASSAVLNANYAKGWEVNGKPAKEIMNRVGTDIPAGTTKLTFTYKPPGMMLGAVISSISIIIAILLLF